MKIASCATVLAVILGGCVAEESGADDALATGQPLEDGIYEIAASHSGQVLSVEGAGDGALARQRPPTGAESQRWRVRRGEGGLVELVNAQSGACLDVTGGSTDNGAAVQQWSCWGGPNQRWKLVDAGAGLYDVVNAASGKCLDVAHGSGQADAIVQQWDCWGGANQRWRFQAARGGAQGKAVTNSYWIDPAPRVPATGKGTFSIGTSTPTAVVSPTPGEAQLGVQPLHESHVYFTSLFHDQDDTTRWELRLGKGSQIYSLKTSRGELVTAQPDVHSAWMDQVIQPVLASRVEAERRPAPDGGRYFIHQAGTYSAVNRGLMRPYYSPMLGSELDAPNATFHTIVWPQQVEVEHDIPWRSHFLLQQDVRDVGDGVIEITYVYTNFGQDTIDFMNLPWAGLAHSKLPSFALSDANGGWGFDRFTGTFDADGNKHLWKDTNGWMAFTERDQVDTFGLGLVFGRVQLPDENPLESFIRYGRASDGAQDTTIVEAIHQWNRIVPGDSFFFRYYLIVNDLEPAIHRYGNDLRDAAHGGTLHFEYDATGLIDPCAKAGGAELASCGRFFGLDRPVDGARPILLVRNFATGRLVVVTDPYALSDKPYLGDSTEYLALLGWGVVATGDQAPHPGMVKLSSLLSDRAEYPAPASTPDVWVIPL